MTDLIQWLTILGLGVAVLLQSHAMKKLNRALTSTTALCKSLLDSIGHHNDTLQTFQEALGQLTDHEIREKVEEALGEAGIVVGDMIDSENPLE